jgi:hypothetical protein
MLIRTKIHLTQIISKKFISYLKALWLKFRQETWFTAW